MDITLNGLALVGLFLLVSIAVLYWCPQSLQAVAIWALSRRAAILAAKSAHEWIERRVSMSVLIEPSQAQPKPEPDPK